MAKEQHAGPYKNCWAQRLGHQWTGDSRNTCNYTLWSRDQLWWKSLGMKIPCFPAFLLVSASSFDHELFGEDTCAVARKCAQSGNTWSWASSRPAESWGWELRNRSSPLGVCSCKAPEEFTARVFPADGDETTLVFYSAKGRVDSKRKSCKRWCSKVKIEDQQFFLHPIFSIFGVCGSLNFSVFFWAWWHFVLANVHLLKSLNLNESRPIPTGVDVWGLKFPFTSTSSHPLTERGQKTKASYSHWPKKSTSRTTDPCYMEQEQCRSFVSSILLWL